MAENMETNIDVANEEAFLTAIDEARSAIELSYNEFRSAYSKLQAAHKKHLKIKSKADAKPSARNLAKLQLSKQEIAVALKNFKAAEKKANDALIAYERAQEKYADYQLSIGNKREARKITRVSDRFLKSAERRIERIVEVASDIVNAIELEAELADVSSDSSYESEQSAPRSSAPQQLRYDAPQHMYTPYYDPYMARPGISIAPVNVDVSAMVESAVRETVAKLQQALDARLAEYIAAVQLPEIDFSSMAQQAPRAESAAQEAEEPAPILDADATVEAEPEEQAAPATTESAEVQTATEPTAASEDQTDTDELSTAQEADAPTVAEPAAAPTEAAPAASAPTAAYTSEDVERASVLASSLDALLAEIAKLTERAQTLAEAHRATNEMLRISAREAQGIQVKQRLVNQEQEALVASNEAILEAHKLIVERQQTVAEQQQATAETVTAIIESQQSVDSALKASLQLQKTLLQTNAKNADLLTKQIAQANAMRDAIPTTRGRKPSARKVAEDAPIEEAPTEEATAATE